MIDQRIIEQIIEANDIVSVIEQYIPLKKSGTNFKACCPFHEEKTPSFTVSDKKQIYKCFGCGKGGNVLHFVKEIEKISFWEAMEKLAGRAGIVLEKYRKKQSEKTSKTSLLLTVYELAKEYYCDNLHKFGDEALAYLKKRNISESTINSFQLGYAPNSKNGLLNYLVKNSINNDIILQSGLIIKTQYGNCDLFRDRLIIPIHSSTCKVVAFGARALSAEYKGGKYINSPTTPIYTKGDELYGFYLTKNDIGKKDAAIITEGYTDFMRLYESGFTNSVASLGTALTGKQIKLLLRYANNIYLLYDGDTSGRKAAVEAAKNIIKQGAEPYIVELPNEEDADSFIQKNGAEELKQLIAKALTLTDFLYNDKSFNYSEKQKIEILIELMKDMNDQLSVEILVKKVAETFNISQGAILKNAALKRINKKQEKNNDLTADYKYIKYIQERNLLIYMINGAIEEPEILNGISAEYFFVEKYKKIFELFSFSSYIINNGVVMSIMTDLEDKDPMLVELISELLLEDLPYAPLEAVIEELRIRKEKEKRSSLSYTDNREEKDKSNQRMKETGYNFIKPIE